ncbi:hypothetical protein MMC16_002921 [Acarospora aff. strigata]|nr:hypothetical protein [Acarospora aff. strigata]
MTRLFGAYRCTVCNCVPNIGWVYTCTQDLDGALQLSTGRDNLVGEGNHRTAVQEKNGRGAGQLSEWIVRAIEDGHYTAEQIEIMRAQKRRVKETIKELEASFQKEYGQTTPKSILETTLALPSKAPTSLLSSPVIVEESEKQPTPHTSEQEARSKIKLFPECRWTCCLTCRPVCRDRSWQSLDGVITMDREGPTGVDFFNRKVTDVKTARNLGLRMTSLMLGPFENAMAGLDGEDETFAYRQLGDTDEEDEEVEENNSSKGFRASVKRAFRGMLMSQRRHSRSSSVSRKSETKSKEQETQEDSEFDIGLWHEMNDQVLREAADVRLPGKDGMDGLSFEEGEVEVEDGVAVTEEAVDLGTADIIMSV